jgi:hypothetical protein
METEVNSGCLVADLDSEDPQLMMLVLDEQLGVVHRGDLSPTTSLSMLVMAPPHSHIPCTC